MYWDVDFLELSMVFGGIVGLDPFGVFMRWLTLTTSWESFRKFFTPLLVLEFTLPNELVDWCLPE